MEEEKPERAPELLFHFVKSPSFRTIHVDGAFGGVVPSPDANLHVALYSERTSIPDMAAYALQPDGYFSQLPVRTVNSRPGVIREVEVNIIVSVATAKVLHEWLGGMIKSAEMLPAVGVRLTPDGTVMPPQKKEE